MWRKRCTDSVFFRRFGIKVRRARAKCNKRSTIVVFCSLSLCFLTSDLALFQFLPNPFLTILLNASISFFPFTPLLRRPLFCCFAEAIRFRLSFCLYLYAIFLGLRLQTNPLFFFSIGITAPQEIATYKSQQKDHERHAIAQTPLPDLFSTRILFHSHSFLHSRHYFVRLFYVLRIFMGGYWSAYG